MSDQGITRVGQNHTYTVYIRYFWLGLEITKYTGYIYVYIRFWPTLGISLRAIMYDPLKLTLRAIMYDPLNLTLRANMYDPLNFNPKSQHVWATKLEL
jgi:hypothetical protein